MPKFWREEATMAEEPSRRRRLVKNPDTFREKVQRSSETSAKPGWLRRLLGPIFRPLGKALRTIFKLKPLAVILKVLRRTVRFIVPGYFVNSWRELRLVTWPNWKQSRQLTFAVLVFAIVFGAAIAAVDYGLDKIFRNVLLK